MSFVGTKPGSLVAAPGDPWGAGRAFEARNPASSALPPIQFRVDAVAGWNVAAHPIRVV